MSAKNNILIITNNNDIAQILKPKLVLLREIDSINAIKYSEAMETLKSEIPDAVLLYCENDKTDALDLVKEIKSDKITENIEILLVLDKYEQDFALSAYDEGIADYFVFNNDDAEVLIRTIWCLKKNILCKTVKKQDELLKQLNIINPETEFYTNSASEIVFNNELKHLAEAKNESVMLYIKPLSANLNVGYISNFLKKSTRTSDIISHGETNSFFLLLTNTSLDGAYCVWDKIRKAVGEKYSLCASAYLIAYEEFKDIKSALLQGIANAETCENNIYTVNTTEKKISQGWLEKINSSEKNFKLFKQTFLKKLENVIAPTFYQEQLRFEDKLLNTKIEQYSNEKVSAFILKTEDRQSVVKITYPGFSKLNIDIIHEGLDSPENKRMVLDLAEFDENKLTEILDKFIDEFNSTEE